MAVLFIGLIYNCIQSTLSVEKWRWIESFSLKCKFEQENSKSRVWFEVFSVKQCMHVFVGMFALCLITWFESNMIVV